MGYRKSVARFQLPVWKGLPVPVLARTTSWRPPSIRFSASILEAATMTTRTIEIRGLDQWNAWLKLANAKDKNHY